MSVKPDARLSAVAQAVRQCRVAADIGCDHGRLGISLLQRGQAEKVLFCDISASSLAKAERLARLTRLESRSRFYVTDGMKDIPEEFDCAVIAGMGGELIRDILLRGRERLGKCAVVASPNVDPQLVRGTIEHLAYHITDEALVRDGKRLYTVIRAVPGEASLSDGEREIGPVLIRRKTQETQEMARFQLRVLTDALRGAERGNDADKAAQLSARRSIWERYLADDGERI